VGTTTISAGTLRVGNGATAGTLGNGGGVVDDAALSFNRNDSLTVNNAISGSGTVTQLGGGAATGTTILTGANSYTGTTTITGGTLQIGNGGTTGTLGTGGGVVDNAALSFNRSNALSVGNLISGTGTVSQDGGGTTTLSADNTYTGTTTVNAGTLLINGNQSAATGAVTVNSGGTLGGTGTIGSSLITVNSGGNLSPGSSPGILNTGAVTLSAGSNLQIEINGTTVGSQYDQLNVTGAVTITGSNLVVTVGTTLTVGEMFTIINNDGTDAVVGQFVQDGSFFAGGAKFNVNYAGGTGNDVVLTVAAVPEPSTWIGGALAVAALAYLQRRRFTRLLKRA
jgi:fibronectin-binding autotransporter adhesin